jgi:hypothetical protein
MQEPAARIGRGSNRSAWRSPQPIPPLSVVVVCDKSEVMLVGQVGWRKLGLAAAATLLGLLLMARTAWYVGSPLLVAAAWLIVVERSVGVARFARFDPWPPRTRRGRRLRAALVTVVLLASLALAAAIGLKHPDPPAVVACSHLFLGVYTWWAIAFIHSHDVEHVIRAKAPD